MNHHPESESAEVDPTPLTYADLKRWLGLVVLLILAALLIWALKSILLLFAVVFLLAMVLNPIVAFMERRHFHRGLAVTILALGFVGHEFPLRPNGSGSRRASGSTLQNRHRRVLSERPSA